MPEMVLPGVYIEVRDEGLIGPGRVSLGNIGIVGTASKGKLGEVVQVGSYGEAEEIFGKYDAYGPNALTLVRALELAYDGGASTVYAVRVGAGAPAAADYAVAGSTVVCAKLQARTPGTWGNNIEINVFDAADPAFIENEKVPLGAMLKPSRKPAQDGRNRVSVKLGTTGQTKVFDIVYAPTAPTAGKVQIDVAAGTLLFDAAETPKDNGPGADDEIVVSYAVAQASSRKVTLRYGNTEEVYTVADGGHLMELVEGSALVEKAAGAVANPLEVPQKSPDASTFVFFGKGTNTPGSNGEGADDTDYKTGLAKLLGEPVHIVVGAGRTESFADELAAHVANASTDLMKGERIAVVGTSVDAVNTVRAHTVASDRVVLVTPGLSITDAVNGKKDVKLPGAYTAAVVAGMISARDAHVSLTNKPVPVGELSERHTPDKLKTLVEARVLVVEEAPGRGRRVVKGITTDDGAFRQITTRRIVDFARYGVRQAASPYIGRLNNERVRGAMKATITGFLQEMLDDEKLIAFTCDVSATRQEEIAGIARVTIGLQPTFSIDFVKVTMILS